MVVHPNSNDRSGTLVHALLHHCDNLSGINGVERPGIVHRIDKDTTGLLLVAKNDVAHRHLSDQFRDHSTERLYVALVWGGAPHPSEGTITTRIGRDPRDRKRMASVPAGGKVAVTHYQVFEDYGPVAMVQCALDTGRTHQIRVHLSELGHPLVGDPVYGGLKKKWLAIPPSLGSVLSPLRGQMLHAATLGFIHPRTDAYMKFQTPPHAAMAGAIAALRTKAGIADDALGPWQIPDAPSFGRTDALMGDGSSPLALDPDW
jgi:23S rRNA pseudouridine1911/1915/1917 synthase